MVMPFHLDEIAEEVNIVDGEDNASGIDSAQPIETLPDDCFSDIFDMMALNDLDSFGQTSALYQEIATKYFCHEFKSKWMEIKMTSDGVWLGPNGIALRSFAYHVPTIKIHDNNIYVWILAAKQFKNIKKIIFNKRKLSTRGITAEHGNVLHNILHDVECIEYERHAFTDEHGTHILGHCPNLKRLVIGTEIFKPNNNNNHYLTHVWLEKMFPALETIQFNYGFPDCVNYDQQGDKIRKFFLQNPTIKHLTIILNIEDSLNFIHKINIHLDKLSLQLTEKMNLKNVVDILNLLYARKQIKSYELILQDRGVLEKYADLINNINGLEMVYMKRCKYDWMQNYPAFFNKLKVLHIGDISPKGAQHLASNAVHLEEIYINRGSLEIIKIFVSRAANLKQIVFKEATGHSGHFDWLRLVRSRAMLDEAQDLRIFVHDGAYVTIKNNEIPYTMGLIELKRSESLMPYRPC